MIRSLYSGISGLQAHGTAIDVTADNIANVNTPGFKAARAQFQALVAQTLQGAVSPSFGAQNPLQVGLGVMTGAVTRQMTQGSPQTTGRTRIWPSKAMASSSSRTRELCSIRATALST